jgi:hypothetical protein
MVEETPVTRTCAAGHVTTATDYCGTCGIALVAVPAGRPGAADAALATGPLPTTEPLDEPVVRVARATPATPLPRGTAATAAAAPGAWVAEVWVDPDWYAEQDSTDPLPAAGPPVITGLDGASLLVGRSSRSRGVHADVDLAGDGGTSRRHARLTTDGTRWYVEDLGSANGTYVGRSSGPLPSSPVPPGQPVEVGPDDRVYLGAWTRIVIRRATPGEV